MRKASLALQTSNVLQLHKLVDRAPIIVADQTPVEIVVDMFRKLGCRQIFVTKDGYHMFCFSFSLKFIYKCLFFYF